MISKPQQSSANGTDYVKFSILTGNDLKTFLLQYSAFHCVFPFLPLASPVLAIALFISHSMPFLPFYSFIPEISFLFVFAFFAQLLLGQEKFTIRGEFPDNSLDGKYVLLIDKSYLLEEREGQKQAYDNSIKIKVIGKEFFYEGTVTRKPFFAQISYDAPPFHKGTDINLFVEPGNIYIRMVDWDTDANVSGTSINEDYNTYILERKAQWSAVYWNRDRRKMAEDSTKTENSKLLDTSLTEQRSEGRFTFLEKYAKYPNVIRVMLARDLRTKYPIREPELSQYLRIIDLMPQADRDAFLSWWDYIMKEREFKKKSRMILDSLIGDPPRFIETIPSSSSSTTIKNE